MPVIPPKSNRKEKRDYDRALYKLRHLVQNGFLEFKQWRGLATRYAKNSLSYLAIGQIRAMAIWTKLLWRHPLGGIDAPGKLLAAAEGWNPQRLPNAAPPWTWPSSGSWPTAMAETVRGLPP